MPAKTSIPWSQISAKGRADYQGDGLAVSLTAGRARLRCILQRLEGEATREGLWLTSIVIPPSGTVRDRFRVVAADLRRLTSTRKLKAETVNEFQSLLTSAATWDGSSWSALGSGMGGFPSGYFPSVFALGEFTGRHCDHRDPGGDALPALGKAKAKAQDISCRNSHGQLQLCWHLYVDDNNQTLPKISVRPKSNGSESRKPSWVVGEAKDDVSTTNLQRFLLFPYNRSVAIYRCPADKTPVLGNPSALRTRIYELDAICRYVCGRHPPGTRTLGSNC